MGEVVISLNQVSKSFKRYERPVDRLKEILLPGKSRAEEYWALRNVNLDIEKGTTLGIIGQNGSGKSTLLQLIAKTLTPTTGLIAVRGRVSALLELGSGFNPEFTGRQNVFFNGRILGLTQAQIEKKFDEIAAFADIGDFIDQPVKTYSSGMFVRLAFSVAINVDPDILIVDEALAVGDIYFQQKCFIRLRELRDSGVTLLFVSHDSGAILKLCDRAILIEKGNVLLDGEPRQAIDLYEAKLLRQHDADPGGVSISLMSSIEANPGAAEIALTSAGAQVEYVKFLDEDDQEIQSILSNHALQLAIGITFLEDFNDPHVGFKIRNRTGEVIFETNTFCMRESIGQINAKSFLEVRYSFHVPLLEGEYTITVGIADGGHNDHQFERVLSLVHNTAILRVLRDQNAIVWSGLINLDPVVKVCKQISAYH